MCENEIDINYKTRLRMLVEKCILSKGVGCILFLLNLCFIGGYQLSYLIVRIIHAEGEWFIFT